MPQIVITQETRICEPHRPEDTQIRPARATHIHVTELRRERKGIGNPVQVRRRSGQSDFSGSPGIS